MHRYIVFEGCDYTGKTTMARKFVDFLTENDIKAQYTKEPGSALSEVCVSIRELIINAKDIKNPETYSYLFAADSYEHMHSYVEPLLDDGVIVVSDRCMLSDFAYRPVLNRLIRTDNFKLFKSLNPSVIWLRADHDTIMNRFKKRKDTNLFEEQHVMTRISEIDNNYKNFFENNRLKRFTEFFNEDDNNYTNDLFNKLKNKILEK